MVLTQLWKTLAPRCALSCFHTTMVLTQLSLLKSKDQRLRHKFPYHYGSYATRAFDSKVTCGGTRFHTTMVLTQQEFESLFDAIHYSLFPYHYGSYATVGLELLYEGPSYRFHTTMVLTQHIIFVTTTKTEVDSFHTTMVLTQQKTIKDQDAVLVTFPYHYGSYAT